jgi:hypothetical protein
VGQAAGADVRAGPQQRCGRIDGARADRDGLSQSAAARICGHEFGDGGGDFAAGAEPTSGAAGGRGFTDSGRPRPGQV